MQLTVAVITPIYYYTFVIICGIVLQKARSFHIPPHTCTKISTTRCHALPPAWREAEVDYSAANEYVEAHYGENAPSKPYFRRYYTAPSSSDTGSNTGSEINGRRRYGRVVEPIHDARNGVYDHSLDRHQPASLPLCGFSLRRIPSDVTDWSDVEQIRRTYLRELEAIVPSVFPDRRLRHDVAFWNPMLRGEDYDMARDDGTDDGTDGTNTTVGISTSNVASMVHIDTDVGAFDSIDELVAMVDNNRVNGSGPNDGFSRADIVDSISAGHRFAIVNFWRNVGPTPVERAPLALLDTRYTSDERGSFPYGAPDPIRSRWYTFPDMTGEECLLFLQYDRSLSQPSDIWHCALPSWSSTGDGDGDRGGRAAPRRSFDVRALFVFDEKVSAELDRFGWDRRRPVLDLEESGCFCEGQAEDRRRERVVLEGLETN